MNLQVPHQHVAGLSASGKGLDLASAQLEGPRPRQVVQTGRDACTTPKQSGVFNLIQPLLDKLLCSRKLADGVRRIAPLAVGEPPVAVIAYK